MNGATIGQLIVDLASDDRAVRLRAARQLYDRGCLLAREATAAWRVDEEVARMFISSPTVGVAVRPETFERIHVANDSPPLAHVPPDQDAREFELKFAGGISLDLLTTREPGGAGAIARYLDRRGEALQQVELPVQNLDRATSLLRERLGLVPVYPVARPGAGGTRVNFFLLALPPGGLASEGADKVLIELVEAAP